MKRVLKRIVWVAAAQLALFEVLLQCSVHWRESADELGLMVLVLATLVGCIWAVLPAIGKLQNGIVKAAASGLAGLVFFALLNAANYYYSWHVRPNIGLYEEPGWVQQHPGFQRELQQRIAANKWKAP